MAQKKEPTQPETAVVVAPPTAVANPLSDMLFAHAGEGFEHMGAGDFAIPFIVILQKGSPQVSRANAKYVKGAEAGAIYNTVSQEFFPGDVGVDFIPCGYSTSMVEWMPRESGGGLVAHHRAEDAIVRRAKPNERGHLVIPDSGNIIVQTAYHFGLCLLPGAVMPEMSVISMYSSQLKTSRIWNTAQRKIMLPTPDGSGRLYNPPMFSHIYTLRTIGQTRDQYDWYGWQIETKSIITDPNLFQAALVFADQIAKGAVKLSTPPSVDDEAVDDVPF